MKNNSSSTDLLPFSLSEEYRILFSAANADSFQEIAEKAGKELAASVIIADSLHYILALSADLTEQYEQTPSWLDLIEDGYTPPVAEEDSLIPIPRPSDLCEQTIGENLVIHDKLKTKSDRFCIMCDILDKGEIILKLAVSSSSPLPEEKKQLILALSLSVQFAYHRLHIDTSSDARGRYLLELLTDGGISEKGLLLYQGFDPVGDFELLSFDTDDLGQHNLSFLPIAADISKMPQCLSVMDGGFCILMINKKYEHASLYQKLEDFSTKYAFPILISPSFSNIKDTPEHYQALKKAASIISCFSDLKGLHQTLEFSLFLFFESANTKISLHPDALRLFTYDQEKQSQYALTVYCYLFHNCEAPASAEALYIHRNTLDKRLRKIESLITGSWRDVSYQFLMLFSLYKLLRKNDLLPYYETPFR